MAQNHQPDIFLEISNGDPGRSMGALEGVDGTAGRLRDDQQIRKST